MFPTEGAPEGLQNLPKLIPLYHSKEASYDCRHRPIFPQMLKQIGDDVSIKILAPLRKMGIIIDKIEYLITDCLVVRWFVLDLGRFYEAPLDRLVALLQQRTAGFEQLLLRGAQGIYLAGITRSKGTTRTTSRSPLSRSLQSEFSNVWWAWIDRLLPSRREGGRIHLPSQNCSWPWRKSKNWAAARKSHSYYAWSTWGEESNWTRRARAPRKNVRFRSNWSSDRFQGSPGSPRVSRWRATASRLVSVFMAALYISLDILLIPCKLQLF